MSEETTEDDKGFTLPDDPNHMVWNAAVAIAAGLSAAIPTQVVRGEACMFKDHLMTIPVIAHTLATKLVMAHVGWCSEHEETIREFREITYDDISDRAKEMCEVMLKTRSEKKK